MEVIKTINNNVAICRDSKGRELIAFGRGIGFGKVPYKIDDMKKVNRTFYDVKSDYLAMIKDLPMEVLELAAEVIDEAKMILPYELSPNAFLPLADHITFSIKRAKQGVHMKMPLSYEMKQLYPLEMRIAKDVIKAINRRFDIFLDESELTGIAMNLVNSGVIEKKIYQSSEIENDQDLILKKITLIIEDKFNILVDKESFNYARFSTHILYLLRRLDSKSPLNTENDELYIRASEEFKLASECVEDINQYLKDKYYCSLSNEEKLYLIMHINRVCAKEGCNL